MKQEWSRISEILKKQQMSMSKPMLITGDELKKKTDEVKLKVQQSLRDKMKAAMVN